jgi:phospholipid-binding lipoprotein MlaA
MNRGRSMKIKSLFFGFALGVLSLVLANAATSEGASRASGGLDEVISLKVEGNLFAKAENETESDEDEYAEAAPPGVPDPLEPFNRLTYKFNDDFYFYILKPIATRYRDVVPEPLRFSIKNFFTNLLMPIRAINCLLQGKFVGFGTEVTRFCLNTTMGVFGFGDPAKQEFGIELRDEDFTQTLGFYGLGPGIYIHWPIFGPSSVRGTAGLAGDFFLDPVYWVVDPLVYRVAIKAEDKVNAASLSIGDYEALKKAAFDPYIAIRDAYFENMKKKIAE